MGRSKLYCNRQSAPVFCIRARIPMSAWSCGNSGSYGRRSRSIVFACRTSMNKSRQLRKRRLGFSLNSDPRFAYLWLRDWHLYGRVPGWQTQPLLRLVPCVDASDGGQAAPNQVLRANLTW